MTDQEDRQHLADAVRAERVHRGWSKERAAEVAGISSITWKRVEDGLRVQETKARAIEKALGWAPGSTELLLAGHDPLREGVGADWVPGRVLGDIRDAEVGDGVLLVTAGTDSSEQASRRLLNLDAMSQDELRGVLAVITAQAADARLRVARERATVEHASTALAASQHTLASLERLIDDVARRLGGRREEGEHGGHTAPTSGVTERPLRAVARRDDPDSSGSDER